MKACITVLNRPPVCLVPDSWPAKHIIGVPSYKSNDSSRLSNILNTPAVCVCACVTHVSNLQFCVTEIPTENISMNYFLWENANCFLDQTKWPLNVLWGQRKGEMDQGSCGGRRQNFHKRFSCNDGVWPHSQASLPSKLLRQQQVWPTWTGFPYWKKNRERQPYSSQG